MALWIFDHIKKGSSKAMDQMERVRYYEGLLDESKAVLKQYDEAMDAFIRIQKKIGDLGRYIGNEEWERDREAAAKGVFPKNLKCDVLLGNEVDDMVGYSLQLVVRSLDIANLVKRQLAQDENS